MDKIAEVICAAGGIPALAAELSIKQPTIYQWRNGKRKVSLRLAKVIANKWPTVASVHDLRPDFFGPAPEQEGGRDAA